MTQPTQPPGPQVPGPDLQPGIAAAAAQQYATPPAPYPARVAGWVSQSVPGEIDLDAELGELDLSPVPMRVGGAVYFVRRDLTAAQVRDYWARAAAKDDEGALELLLGDRAAAAQLNAALDAMPQQRSQLALARMMEKAGLMEPAGGGAGESAASSRP